LLKNLIKFVVILVLAYAVGRFVVVFRDSRLTGYRAPYIQMQTLNSVVIRWLTINNQVGVVHYGENKAHMASIGVEASSKKSHSIKLTDLKPATRYYYQVGEIGETHSFDPEKHWFYTHPIKKVPTRLWIIGDSGESGETVNQVRDAAINWMKSNPLQAKPVDDDNGKPLIDIWIALGDIAYRSGTNDQFQSALFDTFKGVIANTSLWPIYGNHDGRRWTYFRIFDLPENAEAGGLASGTENYYAIDYSNVHLVMLDSQASDRSADGEMAQWLKNDLAQNKKPWVIAAFHHPPYSKGSHDSDSSGDSHGRMQDMRENILPILEQAGVDLVLSGHSHMYERSYLIDCAYGKSDHFTEKNIVSSGRNGRHQLYTKPLAVKAHQGTVYVVSGSASKVDSGPLNHPAHLLGLSEAGSVVVDVVDNVLTARFINNKGELKDRFSITKTAGYQSSYQGCQ